jgi:hypothetical protein
MKFEPPTKYCVGILYITLNTNVDINLSSFVDKTWKRTEKPTDKTSQLRIYENNQTTLCEASYFLA